MPAVYEMTPVGSVTETAATEWKPLYFYGEEQKMADADYTELRRILDAAYDQSSAGKGAARHGNGKPWHDQPIMTITRDVGLGFPIGQTTKKSQEALGMVQRGEFDAAVRELLGGIVYLAAAVRAIEEMKG